MERYFLEVYVPARDRKVPQRIFSAQLPYQAFSVDQKIFIAESPLGSPFGYLIEGVSHAVCETSHTVMLEVRELSAPQ